jgi:ferrous iron transport protein B
MDEQLIRIAMIGNPNCGKTTVFNQLTGARQHVGNYSGVTVDSKSGICKLSDTLSVEIIDLPGIYSLANGSPEERVVFDELTSGKIDYLLNVIDAGNARRNLYLTTELAELEIPMLLVFNMIDEAEKQGLKFDFRKLESFFGCPNCTTAGAKGRGIDNLKNLIAQIVTSSEKRLPVKPLYGPKTDNAIKDISEKIKDITLENGIQIPARCAAIKLLEEDSALINRPEYAPFLADITKWRNEISTRNGLYSSTVMADFRYGVIAGACQEAITIDAGHRRKVSDIIDKIAINRFLGIPIFLVIMYLVFYLTFVIGQYPMDWLEICFGALGEAIGEIWSPDCLPLLRDLVIDGIIGGVGSVLVFLPNIIILFAAIAFLEGTGYMARAAFVMDGFMHIFGLHGKSFIPMLLGFGCTVPAIMATRTIESRRDRLTTILVLPFMSCGARLPIYLLFISAFFAPNIRSFVMWGIYLIGTIIALLAALVMKSTIFKGDDEVFVMELPPYRMPTMQSIIIQMWERTVMYLKKAGTLILGASIIMFILNTFPRTEESAALKAAEAKYQTTLNAAVAKNSKEVPPVPEELAKLRLEHQSLSLENSYAGYIGKTLAKILKPIGFDWKCSSALVGALSAKELFVAQLGVLYSIEEDDVKTLEAKLQQNYTPLQGFCIMLFCLLTIPCIATIAMVLRETGSWKWTIFQIVLFTSIAYVATLLVYQIGLRI